MKPITVQELIELLQNVEDKTKIVEVHTNSFQGVDPMCRIFETDESVIIE